MSFYPLLLDPSFLLKSAVKSIFKINDTVTLTEPRQGIPEGASCIVQHVIGTRWKGIPITLLIILEAATGNQAWVFESDLRRAR